MQHNKTDRKNYPTKSKRTLTNPTTWELGKKESPFSLTICHTQRINYDKHRSLKYVIHVEVYKELLLKLKHEYDSISCFRQY